MRPFNRPSNTTLYPLLQTWSTRFREITRELLMLGVPPETVDGARERREVKLLRQERPFRVMNQRRRLFAAYWAGWKPDWRNPTRGLIRTPRYERYRVEGPKWLGRRP